jgi:DNA repair protein RadC
MLENYSNADLIKELENRYGRTRVRLPTDVLPLARKKLAKKKQENVAIITLSGCHEIIKFHNIFRGSANNSIVHPREIFRHAIIDRAVAIIAIHNHPSGNLEPSHEDVKIHRRLTDCGKTLGIQLLDSIIVSQLGYFSFVENSLQ